MKRLREELEAGLVKRKGELETEMFARMQVLQDEQQTREREREEDKSKYFQQLEVIDDKKKMPYGALWCIVLNVFY